MSVIKFGTSGWRGIISDTFTFANVELAAHAIAQYLNENPPAGAQKLVIIGHDTRFLGREFATRCAEIIAGYGFEAWLTDRDAPTPVIAHAIRTHHASGGINITASHNPPEWNGLKFNEANGAPAVPEVTGGIEAKAAELELQGSGFKVQGSKDGVRIFNPTPEYFAQLRKLVDFATLQAASEKGGGGFDVRHGPRLSRRAAGARRLGCGRAARGGRPAVRQWSSGADQGEHGRIAGALEEVEGALGLGLDPDADRFAVVDSDGTFINANQVLALTLYHLVKNRHWTGAVVRTVATSHLVDAVAGLFGVKVYETPVGFKYIGALMESEPIIVGGEESGGLSVKGHVPEKDGILACLLMAELVAYEGKVGEDSEGDQAKVGTVVSDRINLRVTPERKEELLNRFAQGLDEFGGQKVSQTVTTDGFKFLLDDGCWVMFRASGTEPVFRCYLEARTARQLGGFREAALSLVQ